MRCRASAHHLSRFRNDPNIEFRYPSGLQGAPEIEKDEANFSSSGTPQPRSTSDAAAVEPVGPPPMISTFPPETRAEDAAMGVFMA